MTFEDYLFSKYIGNGERKGKRKNWAKEKYNWYVIKLEDIHVTYKWDHVYYKSREMRIVEFGQFGVTLTVKGTKTETYLRELGFEQIPDEALQKDYPM